MRFFTEGDADRYVFSEKELPELKGVAEVISSDGSITASAIVTELEKRGVGGVVGGGGGRGGGGGGGGGAEPAARKHYSSA